MSHFLDRLTFFKRVVDADQHGVVTNEDRRWEDTARRAAEALEAVSDERARPGDQGGRRRALLDPAAPGRPARPPAGPSRPPPGRPEPRRRPSRPARPHPALRPNRVLPADDGAGTAASSSSIRRSSARNSKRRKSVAHRRPVGRIRERRSEVERRSARSRSIVASIFERSGVLAVLDQRLAPLLARHRSPRSA